LGWASGTFSFLILFRPLNLGYRPTILGEKSDNFDTSNILKEKKAFAVHKGLFNTPAPVIPLEDMLFEPNAVKLPQLHYSVDDDSLKDNFSEIIQFEIENEGDFNPEAQMPQNLDLEKREFPSFQEFNSEEYDLEQKLYSHENSFLL
jgi:hypothetical protein